MIQLELFYNPSRGRLVYVASPYTHKHKLVEGIRNLHVAYATGYLMNKYPELAFYSPICHALPIASACDLPGDWDFWKSLDETMISRCNELWVLCIDGWEQSKGVQAEMAIAKECGLPIKYIEPLADNEFIVMEQNYCTAL